MCRMTETGTRWSRTLELPSFGSSALWWAVLYCGETRYVLAPPQYYGRDQIRELKKWLKPLYAIRVKARAI